jgi:hypothetical protein
MTYVFEGKKQKKNLIFENLCHFRKEKSNWTFFLYSKPNSFQVKKEKKEKAEPYIVKTYDISEKKKITKPFFL